jgi:hypothetical protein
MPFQVVQPPNEEPRLAEVGKEIVAAARGLGANLEVESFLISWLGGTRVAVERDAAGVIIGLALVAIGKRWVQSDFGASLLFFNGTPALFEFVKQICSALGSSSIFVETAKLSETPEKSTFEITQFHLT